MLSRPGGARAETIGRTVIHVLNDTTDGGDTAVVCEDDPVLLTAIVDLLGRNGFETVGVADRGIDGVGLAAATEPDVLVLDLALAGELGLRLIEAVHVASPATAVVALAPLDELVEAALDAGAVEAVDVRDLRQLGAALRRVATGVGGVGG